MTVNGLRVLTVSDNDEGDYTCRAEVEADGRYDERRIHVQVHGKLILSCCLPHCLTLTSLLQSCAVCDMHSHLLSCHHLDLSQIKFVNCP